ncbi:MAG TPA: carbamoyl phosphate synthase small subunit, partial [Ochrobactrum sp.]|nr:carbamoyl phosphate synthase small subunit [Ochrobactrum sp.]
DALKARAAAWSGLENLDLAKDVTVGQSLTWKETPWTLANGYGEQEAPEYHVVALDFGV